jgi:adenylate cyclase
MAVFGTPFELADFRASAIRAAHCIREVVKKINAEHPDEKPFAIAIGLHAGPMVAGIVGSANRMEFTIIGDTVNTASRMEGLCKAYEVEIVVSAAMLADNKDEPNVRPLGTANIRGKQQAIEIFTF